MGVPKFRTSRRVSVPIGLGLLFVPFLTGSVRFGSVPQNPTSSYLGQEPPGSTPRQFAPDVFTNELHSSVVFSPDGNSVYWSEMDGHQVQFMERENNRWSGPKTVPFALPGGTAEPALAPDGETLFFVSREPFGEDEGENIWRVRRTPVGWSAPEPLGPHVNGHRLHWSMSISADGTLYFGRMDSVAGIFRSEVRDGVYQEAVPVGGGVNTEAYETTPFIAPDGSYLLFSRVEGVGRGGMADLYVSFPGPDGSWQAAVSLGNPVNTPVHEICPVVSPNGEYLFFLRNVDGDLKPHWVRSSVFLDLRDDASRDDRAGAGRSHSGVSVRPDVPYTPNASSSAEMVATDAIEATSTVPAATPSAAPYRAPNK